MERRLPNVVREFLEKAILPEIQKNPALTASCQSFVSLLADDHIDILAMEAIVSSFSPQRLNQIPDPPKPPQMFSKRKEEFPSATLNSS